MRFSFFKAFLALWVLAVASFAFQTAPSDKAGYTEVKPGTSADNGDVQVKNTGERGDGTIKLSPVKAPNGEVNSSVKCGNDSKFDVTGFESGDTLEMTSGCKGTLEGKGGVVNLSGSGAEIKVTNNAPVGGANMEVRCNGVTTVIEPGTHSIVKT